MKLWAKAAATAVGLLLLAAFFFVPVVPYSRSLSIPGNSHAVEVPCPPGGGVTSPGNVTVTCLDRVAYPPVNLTGVSTLSYWLAHSGPPPFASQVEFTQGDKSALVYFRGDTPVAAEVVGTAGTKVNPPGVSILRAAFYPGVAGGENFTVAFRNTGSAGVATPIVWVQVADNGDNITSQGVTWIVPFLVGGCADYSAEPGYELAPGGSCVVSTYLQIPTDVALTFQVEIRGSVGGQGLFYRQQFSQYVQAQGVTPAWVNGFIDAVGKARGSGLTENSTLDRFAALRFATASSQPDISDYGLASDASAFFGTGGSPAGMVEELLFPGGDTPLGYASYLQESGPTHWSDLTNPAIGHYGYYIGQGPYFVVSPGCPVSEVPSAGTNITQYFESRGCTVNPVKSTVWLVLILAP